MKCTYSLSVVLFIRGGKITGKFKKKQTEFPLSAGIYQTIKRLLCQEVKIVKSNLSFCMLCQIFSVEMRQNANFVSFYCPVCCSFGMYCNTRCPTDITAFHIFII